MKSRIILGVIVFFLLTPLWMRIVWQFQPRKNLNIVIVDKTVLNENASKHRSINWILDHEKIAKRDNSFYDISKDYYGFFPGENENFNTVDFDNLNDDEIDSITTANDFLYYCDTYGVWSSEWYTHRRSQGRGLNVYGGLSEKDVLIMLKFKAQKKTIVAEFNILGVPTTNDVRQRFENLFGIHWEGWIARHITSLDTTDNPDLPRWIVQSYMDQNGGKWNFKKEGMLFVHEDGRVFAMEADVELENAIPTLKTLPASAKQYNVPEELIYPYWIEVVQLLDSANSIEATFNLHPSPAGEELLKKNNVPKSFPAVISHKGNYTFYYFAGDFADNPTKFRFSKLWGVTPLKFLMYNVKDNTDRNRFFWEYYLPLMQSILGKAVSDAKK